MCSKWEGKVQQQELLYYYYPHTGVISTARRKFCQRLEAAKLQASAVDALTNPSVATNANIRHDNGNGPRTCSITDSPDTTATPTANHPSNDIPGNSATLVIGHPPQRIAWGMLQMGMQLLIKMLLHQPLIWGWWFGLSRGNHWRGQR